MDVNGTTEKEIVIVRPLAEMLILGIFLGLITLVTIGGNLLVILAVGLVKKLRTSSNFLIVSLALSDLLVGVLVIPIATIRELIQSWSMSETLCDMYISFDVLLCTASILNLCAISIDRYLAITKPLQYAAKRTPKRMFLMIAGVWVVSALISIPPLFGFKEEFVPGQCGYNDNIIYQIYATCGAFYIPLIVMLVLYGRIFMLARRMAQEDAKQKRVATSVANQSGVDETTPAYNPLDQPLYNDRNKSHTTKRLSVQVEQNDQNVNSSSAKNRESMFKRIADVTPEKYPLPPSELCRRRRPRLIHKPRSCVSMPDPSKTSALVDDNKMTVSHLSCTEEFEERVKQLRKLRDDFFAAPPSRHCSSVVLCIRPRDSCLTEPLFDEKRDPIFETSTMLAGGNRVNGHPQLGLSQSIHVESSREAIQSGLARTSIPPPPILSISDYTEDECFVNSPSQGSVALTTCTLVESDKERTMHSGTPMVSTELSNETHLLRPRLRPVHGRRRSSSNLTEKSRRGSGIKSGYLALSKFLMDRRQSSPVPSGKFQWTSPQSELKSVACEKSTGQSLNQVSETAVGNVRSRNSSWASIRLPLRKRKSKGHSDSKAIKTLGVIMGCFCLCWVPFFIIALARPLHQVVTGQTLAIRNEVESLFLWLGYVNSTINPIIYAIFNREFRMPFKEILTCRCRGINARLRSKRYASEFGLGAPATVSNVGYANSPTGMTKINATHNCNDSNNTSSTVKLRNKSDLVDNINAKVERVKTVHSLELPVGTLGRRASMLTNKKF